MRLWFDNEPDLIARLRLHGGERTVAMTPTNTRRHMEALLQQPDDHEDQQRRGHTYTQTAEIEAARPRPRTITEWMRRYGRRTA